MVCLSKPVTARSVYPIKLIYKSSVSASKPICASIVCLSKLVSVGDVCPREPTSSKDIGSTNNVSASNIHPSKTINESNVFSGTPVCSNVPPRRHICGRNVCQSKPTNDTNIRHRDLVNKRNVASS